MSGNRVHRQSGPGQQTNYAIRVHDSLTGCYSESFQRRARARVQYGRRSGSIFPKKRSSIDKGQIIPLVLLLVDSKKEFVAALAKGQRRFLASSLREAASDVPDLVQQVLRSNTPAICRFVPTHVVRVVASEHLRRHLVALMVRRRNRREPDRF